MASLALGVCATLQAQTPASGSQRITTNFRDTDIGTIAEAVHAATGKTIILDPRVRGQVTLISSTPMTPAEFYQAFLSILQVYSFAAVETGNIVKIVPEANVRTVPGNDLPARLNSGSDEMVTQVITARNINAAQLAQVLRPLIAQYGNLAPVPGTNTLIITDRASNVARIMRIISRVDQVGDANIEVIPLQNSTAADIVRTLSALTAGQGAQDAAGLAPRVVADERSNSVLVSGDSAQRLRITTLIAHLDTPVENGGDTEVRYLRYASAEKIAPKLKEQMTGVVAASGAAGGAAAAAADRSTTIWADTDTNALVITAPPKTMRSLLTIVDKLDIPRLQVLVEAIIVDVSTDKSADLGVNWAVFSNEDGTNVPAGGFISPVGGANNNGVSIVDLARSIASPASATSVPLGATFGIGRLRDSGINFAAMIRALRSDANTNVIATPTTTTSDNQEAEIRVVQEVPFITGQYTSTGSGSTGSVNPFTTVTREEVGTIMKITPQINGGDKMMMKIDLESSELAGTTGDASSLITNKRALKTQVLIEDGGTIVIGGLIRDAKIGGESRVPVLSRIPLIGEAFRSRSGKRNKSNLMVFIKPTILVDGAQASYETNRKYNAIRNEQLGQRPRGEVIPILPREAPLLPALPEPAAPAPGATTQPVPSGDPARP
ncbi:MAG: type II secretion system secretin GspD [Steroidobacteraceae bacterium]